MEVQGKTVSDPKLFSVGQAGEATGITKLQVHKWSKRLADRTLTARGFMVLYAEAARIFRAAHRRREHGSRGDLLRCSAPPPACIVWGRRLPPLC